MNQCLDQKHSDFVLPLYGFKKWSDLFTARQLLALMIFVKWTQAAREEDGKS